MKTIILCGGKGMRLSEETEFKPKPLVQVGGMPILLHIMRHYAHYGHKEFILALGYKGDMIKDYFLTLARYGGDFGFDMKTGRVTQLNKNRMFDYKITFAETGEDSLTAKRVLEASRYLGKDEHFMVTYSDGVGTVNIKKLVDFHLKQEKQHDTLGTVTVVHPISKYGRITVSGDNLATAFEEKEPVLYDYINGGFHVYSRKVLEHLEKDEMLEDTLTRLTKGEKVSTFKHDGFWHSMDTMKHVIDLNKMWEENRPWAVWDKSMDLGK